MTENEVRVNTHVALTLRLIRLGKSISDLSPSDIKKIVDEAVFLAMAGDCNFKIRKYVERVVVLSADGHLFINL